MSARALQRVVVRMLYDPNFVDAVYDDPARALADEDLTAAERGWLAAPDRRRWRANPLRRFRTLQALIEEYPVTAALVIRRFGVPALAAFFDSPMFHRAIQDRRSLALEFGGWLMGTPGPASAVARLEHGVAQARRAPPVVLSPGEIATARGVVAVIATAGTLAGWSALRAALGQHPTGLLAAAVDPAITLPTLALAEAPEGLIVDADLSVGAAALSLAQFLVELRVPRDVASTLASLRRLGASAAEAPELLAEFVADGLLIRGG